MNATYSSSKLWLLVLIAALSLVITISAQRRSQAATQKDRAAVRLHQLMDDAVEITRLRGQRERVAWQAKPQTDLLAQVNSIMADCDLPARALAGISGESDTALTIHDPSNNLFSRSLRKQSMSITLNNISPLDLAAFLVKWNTNADLWKVERIEMTHSRSAATRSTNTTDIADNQCYNIRLVVAALYHDQLSPESTRN